MAPYLSIFQFEFLIFVFIDIKYGSLTFVVCYVLICLSGSCILFHSNDRYGFHREHCKTALDETNGDVGKAVEHLLQMCFEYTPKHHGKHKRKRTKSQGECEMDELMKEALLQREEEALALSSIYREDFEERIPNQVWIMNFDLPHITDHYQEKTRNLYDRKQQMVERSLSNINVCRFYQQGHCRFGSSCKFRHKTAPSKTYQEICDNSSAQVYQLEIRFPEGNLYPMEPPLVAFFTANPDFPILKSLNVSKLLFEEARAFAESASPVVFSLVAVLEDAAQMIKVLEAKPLPLSLVPSSIKENAATKQGAGRGRPRGATADNLQSTRSSSSRITTKGKEEESSDSDDSDDDDEEDDSEIEAVPVRTQKNQPFKRDKREIERGNRTLKDQFKRKKVCFWYLKKNYIRWNSI